MKNFQSDMILGVLEPLELPLPMPQAKSEINKQTAIKYELYRFANLDTKDISSIIEIFYSGDFLPQVI